jgi:EAL domain-containing protein (putative c-di-GMP-specific phosphodiesterase class I)/GGDEF domain-containing protein
MRFIKDNKKYNPDKVNLILSVIVSLIFTLIVVSVSSHVSTKLIEQSKAEFDNYCEDMSSGYAQSVTLKIESYFSVLNTFIKTNYALNHTDQEVQKFLNESKDLNHPDFMNVSFVNKKGVGFRQNMTLSDVTDREYFHKIVDKNADYFVSSPIRSHMNNEPVIIIASAVRKTDGSLRGFYSASIKLSTLNKVVSSFLFNKDEWIFILGEHGKFICHPDENMILKTYEPKVRGNLMQSSQVITKIGRGHFKTISTRGTPVTVFLQKIPPTNWTLGLSVPDTFFYAFHQKEIRARIILIILGIITMLILTIIEFSIIHRLHRHQHIETIYDSLTMLWTRQHFETEASKLLKHNPNSKFMFLECDIRQFRFTYQNYGEDASDAMIFYFSRRLNKIAMKYNAIIGRGFADHFYILLKIPSVRKAMSIFKKEVTELNLKTKDYEIPFMSKYGISFFMPENKDRAETVQQLIGQASFAKTTIHENLLTQYAIYNSKLLSKIREERFIEDHMEDALKNGEFYVMYQPKISLATEKVVGAEALVRWQSPKLGLVMPDSFIPLFEQNGFITKLDFYVYEEVFKFIESQIRTNQQIVPISVNMSRNHSKPEKFMHDFLEIFKRYSIPSNLIQVEIIERSVMDDNTLKDITDKLHKEGFTVAMDDFGSGESSLNMLTKIPIDVLKFDRSFLTASTKANGELDKASADFIEILIEMSRVLNKATIFEGVETASQRDFLRSVNCDEAQGFFYSKPLTAQDFIEFIKVHK